MKWNPIVTLDTVDTLVEESEQTPVVILKHSTRCGISDLILNRLERQWDAESVPALEPRIVDVISDRAVSNHLASRFRVVHESPQAIILWKGEVIYHASHSGINFAAIESVVRPLLSA